MERSPQSYLKSSSHQHFMIASPPELRPLDRFISPSPSLSRGLSSEPLPSISNHRYFNDKMSIAAATHPIPSNLLSPPESPETPHVMLRRSTPLVQSHGDVLMTDEPLLPEDGASISLDTPLFNVNEKNETGVQKQIQSIVASRHQVPSKAVPSVGDYNLFVSTAWRLFKADPRSRLRQEKEYMNMYNNSSSVGIHKSPAMGSKRSAVTPRPRPISAVPPHQRSAARPARAPKATPKVLASDQFDRPQFVTPPSRSSADGTPAPRQRLTAPTREDSNFQALPDWSPPLDTLPAGNRSLLQDWRGNPLPIENEAYFELLHPAEAKLASTLRLTPAIYLCSKRRIFIEKVRRTKNGKEFRKTDSQKACKIDVNKASKLWTAFDKVGWFDRR